MLPNLKIWLNHFEYHSEHPRRLPEGIPNVLTVTERRLIAPSIATFQLGEQSSGSNLLRAAYRFSPEARGGGGRPDHRAADPRGATTCRALEGFHGGARNPDPGSITGPTGIFRRIRKLAELEFALGVLLTAELIGNV